MAYLDKLGADVARWQSKGLITAEQAASLGAEARDSHRAGIGFGQILAILAGVLLGAAILIMVASNWEAIPRLWRVAALFALLAAGYVGGAVLKLKGQDGFAEAAWLVGAATFGGAIALVSQMYHITGDETQAILIWCLGTTLAAAALRSSALTIAAVVLAMLWGVWPLYNSFRLDASLAYPVLAAVLWAVAMWTRSVAARYLILLSLISYAIVLYLDHDNPSILIVLTLISTALFAAVILAGSQVERLTGLGDGLASVALFGGFAGLFTLQAAFGDTPHFLWLSIIGLAAAVGALLFGGKLSRGVRWLSYAAFAFQVAMIYLATVGTMLGTAGFFFVAAVGLGLLAFFILRIERRMAAPAQGGS